MFCVNLCWRISKSLFRTSLLACKNLKWIMCQLFAISSRIILVKQIVLFIRLTRRLNNAFFWFLFKELQYQNITDWRFFANDSRLISRASLLIILYVIVSTNYAVFNVSIRLLSTHIPSSYVFVSLSECCLYLCYYAVLVSSWR